MPLTPDQRAIIDALTIEERREARRLVRLAQARTSLAAWCEAGPPTELGPMRLRPWQQDLAPRLDEAYAWLARRDDSRTIRIILIDALPQVGKSEMVSRRGPAYAMARYGLSFGVASYGASLAEEHSIAARALLWSEEARTVFPHLAREHGRRQRQDDWTMPVMDPKQPGARYLARGRDGALTGRMVHGIVLDDMYKDIGDYSSLASRREVDGFLRTSVAARLMERGGLLIDMGTRWGTKDTKAWWYEKIGEMRDQGLAIQFEHWSYPLRAREGDTMGRPVGAYIDSNWTPEKEAAARIMYGADHRAILDCDPEDPSGGLFKRGVHLCHTYPEHPKIAAATCSATYLAVDTAETDGGGDWTVIQWWGVRGSQSLLLRQWRGQWGDREVVRQIGDAIQECRPTGTLIEATSAGKVALAVMRGHVPGLVSVPAAGQGSKRDRIKGTLLLYANGDVLFPDRHGDATAWMYQRDDAGQDLIDRLAALRGERPDMRGEVDDEADAATVFLRWRVDQGQDAAPDYDALGAALAGMGSMW